MRRVRRLLAALVSVPAIGTYVGMALIVLGFGLMVLAWIRIAALSYVQLQLPYLASAGFGGLAVVVCGVGLVCVDVRHRDAAAREAQVLEMASMMRELRQHLEQPEGGR